MQNNNTSMGEIIIYENGAGQPSIQVCMEGETVWLSQAQMAELFNTTRQNITIHIKNIFDEGELDENSVCKESLHTASDGKNYQTKSYNLDLIISLGYRIKSQIATRFRQWATKRLNEYIVKKFTTHDTSLLSYKGEYIRDQFWFTDKDQYGAGKLYSLAEFNMRNDTEYSRKYLEGRFGALPFIKSVID